MQLPPPNEQETAFGYYRRLLLLIGDKLILNKEEKEIVRSAVYESLEANLGHYYLNGEALEELNKAHSIL